MAEQVFHASYLTDGYTKFMGSLLSVALLGKNRPWHLHGCSSTLGIDELIISGVYGRYTISRSGGSGAQVSDNSPAKSPHARSFMVWKSGLESFSSQEGLRIAEENYEDKKYALSQDDNSNTLYGVRGSQSTFCPFFCLFSPQAANDKPLPRLNNLGICRVQSMKQNENEHDLLSTTELCPLGMCSTTRERRIGTLYVSRGK